MAPKPPRKRLAKSHFQPTRVKRECLGLVADYFCLNAKMVAELLGLNERSVQRHFAALATAKLVYALRYYPEGKTTGAAPLAYGLSNSGVSQAFAEGFASDSTKTFRDHSAKTVEHELLISKFHLELVKLAAERGWDLRWRQRNISPFRKKGSKDRSRDAKSVNPDALFAINGRYFFLEIERGKLGNYRDGEPQIVRKLRSYWDYYDSTGCEREFGFRKFRVAVVMRTPERAANLAQIIRGQGLSKATFLLANEQALLSFTSAKDSSAVPLETIVL